MTDTRTTDTMRHILTAVGINTEPTDLMAEGAHTARPLFGIAYQYASELKEKEVEDLAAKRDHIAQQHGDAGEIGRISERQNYALAKAGAAATSVRICAEAYLSEVAQ